jgi:hypothetical protein
MRPAHRRNHQREAFESRETYGALTREGVRTGDDEHLVHIAERLDDDSIGRVIE